MTNGAPKYLLGRKVGCTHVYRENGDEIPVTVITAGPCTVAQVKTAEKDGYLAVQLAFDPVREKLLTKPRNGHLKKLGVAPHRVLREVRFKAPTELKTGDVIKADAFQAGDRVDVIGTVKGRGFQGVIVMHNFAGKPQTHGGMNQRGPGSIGMHSQPGMVLRGHRMASHWGDSRATVRNLEVVEVDAENNAILVRGSVPGARGSLVTIRAAKAYLAKQKG
jgi:large subunit ribosomal protein L3